MANIANKNKQNKASQTNAVSNMQLTEKLCHEFSQDPAVVEKLQEIASKYDVLGARDMKKYQLCQRLLQDRAGRVSADRWVGAGLGARHFDRRFAAVELQHPVAEQLRAADGNDGDGGRPGLARPGRTESGTHGAVGTARRARIVLR